MRRAAAWAILVMLVPLGADVASDPYASGGLWRSWWRGARLIVFAGVPAGAVAWAIEQLRQAAPE